MLLGSIVVQHTELHKRILLLFVVACNSGKSVSHWSGKEQIEYTKHPIYGNIMVWLVECRALMMATD
jgi:hypothetical protein